MSSKTYCGSCHCGDVRFEAEIDLAAGAGKCNCSICTKLRAWGAIVPPDRFRITAGEDALADYWFDTGAIPHPFCKRCGVHPFARGQVKALGGEFVAVHLNCLDEVSDDELAGAPVHYLDGRADNWETAPAVTQHL